jgi:hypothetical protein
VLSHCVSVTIFKIFLPGKNGRKKLAILTRLTYSHFGNKNCHKTPMFSPRICEYHRK